MWQQLLERFIPLMDGDASSLDQRDGVGRSTGLVATSPGRATAAARPAGRTLAAYEGSISPLTS